MQANSFGKLFTFTSFGESHGKAVGCVVDGCPPGIPLTEADIQPWLDRRRPGRNRFVSPRSERDAVEIMSGVYEGATTGHPIMLMVHNRNQRSKDYEKLKHLFRPGHADAAYTAKYGVRDPRGGGRSSARETIARVAAGAVARQLLAHFPETRNIAVTAGLTALGGVQADTNKWRDDAIDQNPFFCPDPDIVTRYESILKNAVARNDSLGGIVEIRARNVPPGLGEPVYDRLDGRIGAACLGLNAVKGVEIGDGFAAAAAKGSENNDAMRTPASGRLEDAFLTNHAGGILGGISTGQPIIVRCALKPTPSIGQTQHTVDADLKTLDCTIGGRHDPAVCIRAVPVLEATLAFVLADFHLLRRANAPLRDIGAERQRSSLADERKMSARGLLG